MTRDDLIDLVDQDRIAEAEPLDAFGDLSDLLIGVGACVVGIELGKRGGGVLDPKV